MRVHVALWCAVNCHCHPLTVPLPLLCRCQCCAAATAVLNTSLIVPSLQPPSFDGGAASARLHTCYCAEACVRVCDCAQAWCRCGINSATMASSPASGMPTIYDTRRDPLCQDNYCRIRMCTLGHTGHPLVPLVGGAYILEHSTLQCTHVGTTPACSHSRLLKALLPAAAMPSAQLL